MRLGLGIFGGSFDPIHNAHLIVAELAREQLGLDRVLFLVAGSQPLKQGKHHADSLDRAWMVSMAIEGIPGMAIDQRELDRPGPSYMVDTLRELNAEYPDHELILLLGADAAGEFEEWREPEEIRRLARIAVFRRGQAPIPRGFDLEVAVPRLQLSSTDVRARAAQQLPLVGWVTRDVADYIAVERLYGSNGA
jgi:nicotinate-nucleotide adenylyltransferase